MAHYVGKRRCAATKPDAALRRAPRTQARTTAAGCNRVSMIAIRSALFNVFFYVMTFTATFGLGVPVMLFAPSRALDLARWWARVMLRALAVLCEIRLDVSGMEHIPAAGPALIAAQHQSAFDTIVWLALLPRCCYVLKEELTRIPVFGRLLLVAGMIPIDRAARVASLHAIIRRGRTAAAAARQIVIFPEGTRAPHGSVLPLHPGVAALASALRLPVIPAVTDSGRLWGRRTFHKHPGTIRLVILPPLRPGLSREQMMNRLAQLFADGPALAMRAVDESVDQPAD